MEAIPKDLVNFVIVGLFSFLFGLEQRKHHDEKDSEAVFGTDRTFTLIGILGFILYVVDKSMKLYLLGGVGLMVLFGIFYWHKVSEFKKFGITSIVVALITYSLTPLIYFGQPWLFMLIVVVTLILVESKEELRAFSKRFDRDEFTTLAKFIIIAGVILPLLPREPIFPKISISPYQFWLAIVVVSGISYFSYLLKKFVFPQSGIVLTAILGGLYSSTATTVILSKKSASYDSRLISGGIILSTGVMYLRILILAFIFNVDVATRLLPYFLILFGLSVIYWFVLYRKASKETKLEIAEDKNPLEFKTALIFGALFTFFAVLSQFVVEHFGDVGLGLLSFIVGITDIDPYLLSIFQSSSMRVDLVVLATMIATASNNLAKMSYAIALGTKDIRKRVILGFMILIILTFLMVIVERV